MPNTIGAAPTSGPAADWQKMVKESPAPFAELENDRVILTFQSGALKLVKNPEALLNYWKDVIVFEDELSAPPVPNHKERIGLRASYAARRAMTDAVDF